MTAKVAATKPFNLNFRRTVTNVGMAKSTYKIQVLGSKLTIRVVPDFLSLKSMYHKTSFTVTVPEADKLASAHLIWSDGLHSVKSPNALSLFMLQTNVSKYVHISLIKL